MRNAAIILAAVLAGAGLVNLNDSPRAWRVGPTRALADDIKLEMPPAAAIASPAAAPTTAPAASSDATPAATPADKPAGGATPAATPAAGATAPAAAPTTAPAVAAAAAATSQPAADPEKLVRDKLKLVQLYIDNRMTDQAKETLQVIIQVYPDTAAAKDAKAMLAELGG